jgi:hypothetical protein
VSFFVLSPEIEDRDEVEAKHKDLIYFNILRVQHQFHFHFHQSGASSYIAPAQSNKLFIILITSLRHFKISILVNVVQIFRHTTLKLSDVISQVHWK